MRNLSYLVVTVLLNSWIIGYVGYGLGSLIHILPVVVLGIIMSAAMSAKVVMAKYK